MPIIHVELLAGRSMEMKLALAQKLTEAATEALGIKPESVRVILSEVEAEHWFVGGQSKAPGSTHSPKGEVP
jgi:4-oxalocrotonate tautomerase